MILSGDASISKRPDTVCKIAISSTLPRVHMTSQAAYLMQVFGCKLQQQIITQVREKSNRWQREVGLEMDLIEPRIRTELPSQRELPLTTMTEV